MFAAYACKVFVQAEGLHSVLRFLAWVSGVKILQGLKAKKWIHFGLEKWHQKDCFGWKFVKFPRATELSIFYVCVNTYTVVATDWYALVCHNIWHYKYIPGVSEGGGKCRYSDFHGVDCTFFFLALVYVCLHLGNRRLRYYVRDELLGPCEQYFMNNVPCFTYHGPQDSLSGSLWYSVFLRDFRLLWCVKSVHPKKVSSLFPSPLPKIIYSRKFRIHRMKSLPMNNFLFCKNNDRCNVWLALLENGLLS